MATGKGGTLGGGGGGASISGAPTQYDTPYWNSASQLAARSDLRNKYAAIAAAKLAGTVGLVLEDEFVTANDVQLPAPSSGATSSQVTTIGAGVYQADSGTTNGAEVIIRNANATKIIPNLQTNKWFAAGLVRLSVTSGGAGAIVAGTKIAIGLQGTTKYHGISLDGGQSLSTPKMGVITLSTVAFASGAISTKTLTTLGNANFFEFYFYNDGSNMYGSIAGETDVSLVATASIESAAGNFVIDNFNSAGKAATDTVMVDWFGAWMLRNG